MNLSESAIKVLEKRYLLKDEYGQTIENTEDLFRRVSKSIASAEATYGTSIDEQKEIENKFFEMMTNLDFLPNSPTLMNAGTKVGQLSGCFVVPVGDSMESIFDAVKYSAIIHKSGGGTGFSFSRLRPGGDLVGSTKGVSSGPISFMSVFDAATETVKQGGKRRGANMGILSCHHPNVLDFIKCKDDKVSFRNFNISVAITKQFMDAYYKDEEYPLVNPRDGKIVNMISAKMVFDTLVEHAHKTGDPGVVFMDRINEYNPTPSLGDIESTNPCGEQPLLPFESCNLGSVNLANMVKNGKIDFEKLNNIVRLATRFLDNVIDVNKYPLTEIDRMTKTTRKIGLGIMGFADMLTMLKIPYSSDKAVKIAEDIMKFVTNTARSESEILGGSRGNFPAFKNSKLYSQYSAMRNAAVTTIAPTGTLSIIADCSSGIEPIFALTMIKTVMDGTRLIMSQQEFEKVAKERNFYSEELMEKISKSATIKHMEEIPEDVRSVFETAHDLHYEQHVKMQAAFQKYTDNAVSKTINFTKDATVEDVRKSYLLAYETGCKGITIYRDGSKEGQVLTVKSDDKVETTQQITPDLQKQIDEKYQLINGMLHILPRTRPLELSGKTRGLRTGCGKIYVTVNKDEDGVPFEIFTSIGKAGGCANSMAEAVGRVVSLSLRAGVSPDDLIQQLKGITCHKQGWDQGGRVMSCADAMARALEVSVKGTITKSKSESDNHQGACDECGGPMEVVGGCPVCHTCGKTSC